MFPLIRQYYSVDCGMACLNMVCKFYHIDYNLEANEYQYFVSKNGVSLNSIVDMAKKHYFDVRCGRIQLKELIDKAVLPCILHWDKKHFVVLYDIIRQRNDYYFKVADPGYRKVKYTQTQFLQHWSDSSNLEGIVILLQPNQNAAKVRNVHRYRKGITLLYILSRYRKGVTYIGIYVLIGAVIQVILPFLTQKIVDVGIMQGSLDIIRNILFGEMMLISGNMLNDFYRKNLVLKIGSEFSMNFLTSMVKKMLRLPVCFFDSHQIGDLLQKLQDNDKIERFLTTHFLNMVFSAITIIVLSIIMCIYSIKILFIFLVGSIFYMLWTTFFIVRKKQVNYSLFGMKAQNQSKYLEIIKGIYDIKLQNNIESHENIIKNIQKSIYKLNIKSFRIDQSMEIGNVFINELKNLIITFFSAYLVIKHEFTLGTMLSIQYMIGEMNVPVSHLVTYLNGYQDAKFSLERINSIFAQENEDVGRITVDFVHADAIHIRNLSFRYIRSGGNILHHINVDLPMNKIIAIVGASGKTTLVKLLLKLYLPNEGHIMIGNVDLCDIKSTFWRQNCGAVMQEGMLFSESIKNNITMGAFYDEKRFLQVVSMACVDDFVEGFPYKYETQIGAEGQCLSQGQK